MLLNRVIIHVQMVDADYLNISHYLFFLVMLLEEM